jgi:hypothetical protein
MPKKKVTNIVESEVEKESEANQTETSQTLPQEVIDTDLETLMAEIGPQTKKVSLYRQDDKSATKWHYLTKQDVSEFTMETVKQEFGGGNYKARFIDERGVYITQFLFSIDPRFKPQLISSTSFSVPPGVSITGDPSGLGEIRETLKQITLILAQLSQKKEVDPLSGMEKLVAIITPLIQREPSHTPEASAGVEKYIDMFTKGMEMGQAMNGDSYLPVVEKMGMPLLNMLGELVKNGKGVQAKVAQAVPTNVQVPKEKPQTVPATPGTPNTLERYLQFYIPQLIALAKQDKDPALYADLMLDQIPEQFLSTLHQLLLQPTLIEQLVGVHPEIKNYEQWFKDFIQFATEGLTPEAAQEAGENTTPEEHEEE